MTTFNQIAEEKKDFLMELLTSNKVYVEMADAIIEFDRQKFA